MQSALTNDFIFQVLGNLEVGERVEVLERADLGDGTDNPKVRLRTRRGWISALSKTGLPFLKAVPGPACTSEPRIVNTQGGMHI